MGRNRAGICRRTCVHDAIRFPLLLDTWPDMGDASAPATCTSLHVLDDGLQAHARGGTGPCWQLTGTLDRDRRRDWSPSGLGFVDSRHSCLPNSSGPNDGPGIHCSSKGPHGLACQASPTRIQRCCAMLD
eukprot:6106027-Lingulodinium_polyedra.AAC.1